jgi:hypothetical protein
MRWAETNLVDGHAMTRHKAQGATFDIALVYGSSRSRLRAANGRTSTTASSSHHKSWCSCQRSSGRDDHRRVD